MAVIRLGNLLWKDNTQPNSVNNPVNTKDVNSDAIKNKVDTLATETKLEQVRTLLAGVATEDKLEQARALLQTISGKDFATQTTLAQVKSELELVKAELQAIKANQLSGDQKVQLSGNSMSLVELSQQRSRFFRNGKYLKTVSRSNPGYNVYFGNTAYSILTGIVPFDKRGLTDVGCMIFNDTDKLFVVEALHLWTRYTEDYSEDHTEGYATLSIGLPSLQVPVGATLYIDLLDVIADDVVPFWGFSEGVSVYLRKNTPESTGTIYCSWFGVEAGGVS